MSLLPNIGYSGITASEFADVCVPRRPALIGLNGDSVWNGLGELGLRKARAGECSMERLSAANYELMTDNPPVNVPISRAAALYYITAVQLRYSLTYVALYVNVHAVASGLNPTRDTILTASRRRTGPHSES